MKKNKMTRILLAVLLCIIAISSSFSQTDVKKTKKDKKGKNEIKSDSIPDFNKPQPYNMIITADAQFFKGVFVVAKVKDKYFFEIPNEVLDRDFQVTSRIGKGPAIFMKTAAGNSGRMLESTQIRFTKAPNDKLFVKRFVYDEMATDTTDNGLHRALVMNDLQPVMSAFTIKAYGKNSIVIDVTDYINSDLGIFTGNIKEIFQAASFLADRSYISSIEALANSVEIRSVKTYETQGKANLTTEVNTTFLLLPQQPMRFRYSDDRVGYSAVLRTDLDQDPQRIKKVEIINRWRLEPKPEDKDRYTKGEMVEPQKPIVFYISPTTPKKWVPYIKRAVSDWQAAFEKAGFKNAIYAREATVADSIWNAQNGGLSTINYAANMSNDIIHTLVTDPRSGEIMQANIQINHNVLYALYNTYMIMAGTIDKRAQKNAFSNELMGELLRVELTTHIGTCLGLLKNAGTGSTIPTVKLRDKQWTEKYGISPSVMQNTLFNYVAQPEDNITENGIFSRIGAYDKFAISWGYKLYPEIKDLVQERTYLRKMITDSLQANPQLYYGMQPKENEMAADPRNQPNSLGDDIVDASKLGIKNLKRILPNLPKWTLKEDELYLPNSGQLSVSLSYLFSQYRIYLENASNILGTYYYNAHDAGSSQKVYSCVPLEKQKKAMAFVTTELYSTGPKWLIPDSVADLVSDIPYSNDMYTIGTIVLTQNMLELKKLKNINTTAERFGSQNTYSLVAYLDDLDAGIWKELTTDQKVDSYHMVLQKAYLTAVNTIIDTPRDISNTVVIGITRGHLMDLKQKVMHALKMAPDKNTKRHYQDILSQINTMLDPKRAIPLPPVLPPNANANKSIQAALGCQENLSADY